jgi:transposase
MLDMIAQQTPLAMTQIAGIDVAKDWLDVFVDGRVERIPNQAADIRRLAKKLLADGLLTAGLEPTGGYERLAVDILREAGLQPMMVDCWRLRQFAKSRGTRTKTDPIDARLIAEYVASGLARTFPRPSQAQKALIAWTREVARAEADLRRAQARFKACAAPEIGELLKAEIAILKQTVKRAQAAIKQIIAADQDFARKAQRLNSMPGVGPKTIRVLLAEMPELGSVEPKTASALAGLAAYQRQSGKRKARGSIEGGRSAAKRAAYLAACAMLLHNPWAKRVHDQLIARGKPFRVATVALARRFIVIANALIRDDRDWSATPA